MVVPVTIRRAALIAPALALVVVLGCGGGTGNVSGKVTYQNKPVVSGSVIFYGSNKEAYVGAIDEQGNYRVTGVPSGVATIAVNSPDPLNAGGQIGLGGKTPKPTGGPNAAVDAPKDKAGTRPAGWRALPPQYGDAATSKLTYDVIGGDSTHDIKLE